MEEPEKQPVQEDEDGIAVIFRLKPRNAIER